ncbi:MAG: YgiQ family radical SAM protein [Oscillibacter sp.]|nr:YgiQ family radical SAM protein [Oscillibacter sp.]
MRGTEFLPVTREEMREREWYYYDFLVVTADAYIDHPSFGTAIISRLLEAEGYRVAVLAQPEWKDAEAFRTMGKPRYGVLIGGGNLDSMVAHYTVAKRRRSQDLYSPGGKLGFRPDRATIVYANRAREAFPDTPIVIGGLEASLRRFAHYDYWDDAVRRSILFDAPADLLVYGMGETATKEIARRLSRKTPVSAMTDVRGTAFITDDPAVCQYHGLECPSYEEICQSKEAYARATELQYEEHDPIRGRGLLQRCGRKTLVVNPPQKPLSREELDRVYDLPYVREVHPMYTEPVPAIEEVRFSITHNRGCFGGCNFCALAFHQGRMVTSRSEASVVREAEELIGDPLFKGYIHDVGGPSANFRHTSCAQQKKCGMCKNKSCLAPEPCQNLEADHSEYTALLKKLRTLPGIKKVFVRSGIRYDYLLQDKNRDFFRELVDHHISGQLKVAPEHCVSTVLDYMGKPHFDVFEKFWAQYKRINEKAGKEQFLVPYLMSSHPGCTLQDAVELAEYLHRLGREPEQVQDFYPTPGTLSTCMYYTGIDPRDMKPVYVARDSHEKALQRALLQWRRPEMKRLVIEALQKAGREDLIGYRRECLVRPLPGMGIPAPHKPKEGGKDGRGAARKPGASKIDMSKTDPSKAGAPTAGASRDGTAQPHRDGRGPKPAGAVHRGKKNTPGRKPPMPAAKKKALAARRAGK